MKSEKQIHAEFCAYLDKEGLPYIHSRTDRKHTNTVGDCDFFVLLAGRVLGIEFKVGKNKLSPAQEERIAYLRKAGVVVRVCYDCSQAVSAVQEHFGIETGHGEAAGCGNTPSAGTLNAPGLPVEETGFPPCPFCTSTECLQMARHVRDKEERYSVSTLQRRFRWGYAHAKAIYDALEDKPKEQEKPPFAIACWDGTNYVMAKSKDKPGYEMLRVATPADVLAFPKV